MPHYSSLQDTAEKKRYALQKAKDYVLSQTPMRPEYGIILGTGLAQLCKEITPQHRILYEDIPFFPRPTTHTHKGELIFGTLENKAVIVMNGRFHYYEGYNFADIALPVRLMHAVGVKNLLVSNVSGGLRKGFERGTLCAIKNHINLLPGSPLRGLNLDEEGPRFPDMSEVYHQGMRKAILSAAKTQSIAIQEGVYVAVTGPQLETAAEYRYLSRIGADIVGMSTVPEVIAAKHLHMRCGGLSIITDIGYGTLKPLRIKDVLAVASQTEPSFIQLTRAWIQYQP